MFAIENTSYIFVFIVKFADNCVNDLEQCN